MSQQISNPANPSSRRTAVKFAGVRRSVVEPLRRRRIRVPELAIGIFVIAAAIVVSIVLNTDDDKGTGVLALGRDLTRGELIEETDLSVVTLTADSDVALLSTDLSAQVIGMRAAVDIDAGTPLSSSHLIDTEPLSSRDAVIGVVVDDVVVVTGEDGSIVEETVDVFDADGNLVAEEDVVDIYDADGNLIAEAGEIIVEG